MCLCLLWYQFFNHQVFILYSKEQHYKKIFFTIVTRSLCWTVSVLQLFCLFVVCICMCAMYLNMYVNNMYVIVFSDSKINCFICFVYWHSSFSFYSTISESGVLTVNINVTGSYIETFNIYPYAHCCWGKHKNILKYWQPIWNIDHSGIRKTLWLM